MIPTFQIEKRARDFIDTEFFELQNGIEISEASLIYSSKNGPLAVKITEKSDLEDLNRFILNSFISTGYDPFIEIDNFNLEIELSSGSKIYIGIRIRHSEDDTSESSASIYSLSNKKNDTLITFVDYNYLYWYELFNSYSEFKIDY